MLLCWVKACGQCRALRMTACAENGGWYICGDLFYLTAVHTYGHSVRCLTFWFGRYEAYDNDGRVLLASGRYWEHTEGTKHGKRKKLLNRENRKEFAPVLGNTLIRGVLITMPQPAVAEGRWGCLSLSGWVIDCYCNDRHSWPSCQLAYAEEGRSRFPLSVFC